MDLQGQTFGVWDPDLFVNGTTSSLLGFVFKNGQGTASSPSVLHIRSGSLLISYCDFTQNNASAPYAAVSVAESANAAGTPSLISFSQCSFTNNVGGAVSVGHRPNRVVAFQACTFVGNSADSGAAITANSSSLIIAKCTFTNNSATLQMGGAVLAQAPDSASPSSVKVVISDSTFTGNSAKLQGYAFLSLSLSLSLPTN